MVAVLAAVLSLAGCDRTDRSDRTSDKAAIEAALARWTQDFNARNVDGVCALFADDAVVAYPDSPDRDRDAFCAQMRQKFADPARTLSYDAPDIKEIVVDGDLAAVRLIWTATVKDRAGTVLEKVREDGVDVFQRQPDGSWKIRISHAYPSE